MAKMALCIKASDAPYSVQEVREAKGSKAVTLGPSIFSVFAIPNFFMLDRADCETDPTHLQFIPYVLVVDVYGNLFYYSRGGAGEESRLHGQLSVGLGGHVDSMPTENMTLEQHLRLEACRELIEEAGLDISPEDLEIVSLLVDATTPVQEVHLGLLCILRLTEPVVVQEEKGVIDKGEFVALDVLMQPQQFDRMEQWSKLALGVYSSLPK